MLKLDNSTAVQQSAIEYLPLTGLIPYARNARTHSEAQIAQLAGSIREFGFTNPVLIDADGGIIAGHGRVMAGLKLGLESVPCIRLPHLSDAQRRAYILADNRLALNAGWDTEFLAVELDELRDLNFNMALMGFDQQELNDLIGTPNTPPPPDTSPQLTDGFKFSVIIACADELEQAAMLERFEKEGLRCRPLITQ